LQENTFSKANGGIMRALLAGSSAASRIPGAGNPSAARSYSMMRDSRTPTGWSNRFKRQVALFLAIGVSQVIMFLSHASDVPSNVTLALSLVGLAVALAGAVYVFRHLRSPRDEALSEREWWILGSVMAFVISIIAFNLFSLFSR
jgi:hypothetical protein